MKLPVSGNPARCGGTSYDTYELTVDIQPAPEWTHKGLADYRFNVGTRCGHDCGYCSTGATYRMHKTYTNGSTRPNIDLTSVERATKGAKKYRGKRGVIIFCPHVDGYSPEAVHYDLGQNCIQAFMNEPDWKVRVLTKSDAVVKDFGFFKQYRDRIIIGLSITATPDKQAMISEVEGGTASIQERMNAVTLADQAGLRTYGMLCPLLPRIADDFDQVLALVEFCKSHNAEEIWVEAINGRGKAFDNVSRALKSAGFDWEAAGIDSIRSQSGWSDYATQLALNAHKAVCQVYGNPDRLRYLLYPSKLTASDEAVLRGLGPCVKWLGSN